MRFARLPTWLNPVHTPDDYSIHACCLFGSGFIIWSDPDPVFKIWSDTDPVFKIFIDIYRHSSMVLGILFSIIPSNPFESISR